MFMTTILTEIIRFLITLIFKMTESIFLSIISTIINFSSLLAAIGSLIAAYMAYKAVIEMKKQRQTAVKPDLSLRGVKHFVYWHPNSEGIPVDWSREKLSSKPTFGGLLFKFSRFGYAEMECINIGNGVAKNVHINWNFDINDFTEKLKSIDVHNVFEEISNFNNEGINITSKELGISHIWVPRNEYIDFILPINQEINLITFSLCGPYIILVSINIFLTWYNLQKRYKNGSFEDKTPFSKERLDYDEIPYLCTKFLYTDINNQKFTKNFKIKINFTDTSYPIKDFKWRLAAESIQFEVKQDKEN